MNILKGLAIFCFTILVFSSCFDPPIFPAVPEIEFEKIEFVDAQTDSLILYLNFKDGDGDLGLDNEDLNFISYPYNNAFFFQENNGSLDTLYTVAASSSAAQYDILVIANPAKGKLVFPRTRKKPGYQNLPAFNCVDYEYLIDRNLLIEKDDLPALDAAVRIIDTLTSQNPPPQPPTIYYQIQDTLFVKTNPDHYNIEVDFLVKNNQGEFTEFDWRKEFCTQSFDGRFPILTDKSSALEGTLRYTMNSVGFTSLFSIKILKLRVQIKDRLLHRSNVMETPEFTLDKIKKSG